jgi:hypothetical protein
MLPTNLGPMPPYSIRGLQVVLETSDVIHSVDELVALDDRPETIRDTGAVRSSNEPTKPTRRADATTDSRSVIAS